MHINRYFRMMLGAMIGWAVFAASAEGQIRYHVATNGNDVADGLSWATPLQTIPAALALAVDGDTVMLSNGVFAITAQLEIAHAITLTSTNGPTMTSVNAGNVVGRRVIYLTSAGAIVEDLTLTRGNAYTQSVPANVGGAIYMTAGLVRNCILTNNVAYSYGAGVYLTGGVVSNCLMTVGSAGYNGGSGATLIDGLVTHCVIRNNSATRAAGGVHLFGGLVRNCTIRDNSSGWSGGGVKMEGGTLENCLITGNSGALYPAGTGGGGVYQLAGTQQFCTVVGNQSLNRGGGVFASGGTIRNSVIFNNRASDSGLSESLSFTAATITYSCAPELTNGTGNISASPEFVNSATGNYRLSPGSPCIDSAVTLGSVADDFDGTSRPLDGDGNGVALQDMGAFEADAADAGVFRCHFLAVTNDAEYSLTAQLTAYVQGTATNGLYYRWDFDGNGSIDEEGADKRTVSHLYGPGLYSVNLIASNSLNEVTNAFRTDYIRVRTSPIYVATNGTHLAPFVSWGTAATTIQAAVDMAVAGGTVYVSNGIYRTASQISLSQAVSVVAPGGLTNAIVERLGAGNTRLFGLSHSGALLDGFTIRNGSAPTIGDNGGGIYMTAGMVQNCLVTNCTAVYGGGVYLIGGLITNCTLIKNPTKGGGGGSGRGGGAYVTGGTIVDSLITQNSSVRAGGGVCMTGGTLARCRVTANTSGQPGGGVAMEGGGYLENCLILGNIPSGNNNGGGVWMNNVACRVVQSTISGNQVSGTGDGGGIFRSAGGVVTNSIIYFNTKAGGAASDVVTGGSEASFRFCCASDLINDPTGTGNITGDPFFKNPSGGDYTLGIGSPCIDTGTNLADVVSDLDGAFRPTDGSGGGTPRNDIGAYEAPDPGAGPLAINFSADVQSAPLSLAVAFTALPSGSDTNNLYYGWDYNNDGVDDDEGYGLGAPTHLYSQPGLYSVSLTVSNASHEIATEIKADYIRVYAAETFVSTNGANILPYTNWVTAASNIQDAVDAVMSGGWVSVGEGVYRLSNEVAVLRGITVRGDGGRSNTVIERLTGYTTRLFNLADSNAVLDELTIRNGSAPVADDNGGGVYLSAGTIQNCIITNCTAIYGAGLYQTGGWVSNTLFVKNPTKPGGGGSGQGGGVFLTGGEVRGCTFRENSSTRQGAAVRMAGVATLTHCIIEHNTDAYGGSVNVSANGLIDNCLIIGNSGGSFLGGGGIYLASAGASVLNCTVVGNSTTGNGGGIQRASGGVTNTIVFGNFAAGSGQDISGAGGFGYSCSPDLTHDPDGSGNINLSPQFILMGTGYGLSHLPGNYRLDAFSPCANSGFSIPEWVGDEDLDGKRRILAGRIDMGCYESLPSAGTLLLFY